MSESDEQRRARLNVLRERIVQQTNDIDVASGLRAESTEDLLALLPILTTNPKLASAAAAGRETIALIIQERVAERVAASSDRLARVGNRIAIVGVLVMLGQLLIAAVLYFRDAHQLVTP